MLTPEQLERRKGFLCSSEIAAIFGKDPFQTAYDVWAKKVYACDATVPSEAMEEGNELEPLIIKWVADRAGIEILENSELEFTRGIHMTHLDAFVDALSHIEVKVTRVDRDWGDGISETIPDHFMYQVQHQMLVTRHQFVRVGVWIHTNFGFDKRAFRIPRNEQMIVDIDRIGTKWWNTYVLTKTAPPYTTPPSLDTLKSIHRIPEKLIVISAEEWEAWEAAKQAVNDSTKIKDELFSTLVARLGDASGWRLPDGKIYEWRDERGSFKCDFNMLREKYPDVYAELVSQSSRKNIREIKVKS